MNIETDKPQEETVWAEDRPGLNLTLFETPIGKYYLPTDVPTDIIINDMKVGKVFEPEIVQASRRFIREGTTVLDVGANFGQMTLLFSEFVGEGGHVISFEADEFVCDVLNKNIAANDRHNITVVCKAVYSTCDEVVFYPVPNFQRFGSYGSYGVDPNATEGRKVKTITIDSLSIQTPISFMKVDVQGSDLFALQGAVETIKRNRMPIIFEYEAQFQNEFGTSFDDYMQFVRSIGYKVDSTIYGINYLIVPN